MVVELRRSRQISKFQSMSIVIGTDSQETTRNIWVQCCVCRTIHYIGIFTPDQATFEWNIETGMHRYMNGGQRLNLWAEQWNSLPNNIMMINFVSLPGRAAESF